MNLKEFLEEIESNTKFRDFDTLKINLKRFEVNNKLKKLILSKEKIVYAGKYLGQEKKEFRPSSILLNQLSKEKINKIHLKKDAAWLFVCGRDIFENKINKIEGKAEEDNLFLVLYENNCLGYGKIDMFEGRNILKNIFDIGDFLRRERR